MTDEPILKPLTRHARYYKVPEWIKEKIEGPKKKRGGRRPGAGRPRARPYTDVVKINLNSIQRQTLQSMGDGNLSIGLEKLINENM